MRSKSVRCQARASNLGFQYGSNASQARLLGPGRLNGHGTVIGRAETVGDYDIAFDVWSKGSSSEARLNHSAIHPKGGTVGRGGQRAAHVSHQIGHLFGHREPLQE